MKAARCRICKKELAKGTKNFSFCSARCKLVDAGAWFEGTCHVEAGQGDSRWGEN
jgi:endogenous inhibitor of DNA gyrase (YacG/DUF329 family)